MTEGILDFERNSMTDKLKTNISAAYEKYPLEVFPLEIWEEILHYLVNPLDIESACETCHLFLDILEDRRYITASLEIGHGPKAQSDYGDPYLYIHVDSAHFVEKLTVEEFISDFKDDPFGDQRLLFKSLKIKISTDDYVSFLCEDFTCKRLEKIIELIGIQLLNFEFISKSSLTCDQIVDVYIVLQTLTSLMCNLRRMEIQVNNLDELKPNHDSDRCSIIEQFTFPCFDKLENLTLHLDKNSTPGDIYVQILKSNLDVRSLNLKGIQMLDAYWMEPKFRKVLESLRLESLTISPHPKDSLQALQFVANRNWTLKEINMKFEKCDLTMTKVALLLNRFPTLEKVSLRLVDTILEHNGGNTNIGRLHLPRLTEFQFSYHHKDPEKARKSHPYYYLSIDYLIKSKRLKWLSWINTTVQQFCSEEGHSEMRKELISFNGGLTDLTKSNVWSVFPRLESVQVIDPKDNGTTLLFLRDTCVSKPKV